MTTPRKLTGRHVLFALLGFFGVMLTANGVMVWQALGSFSGQVTEHPYVEGLAHNRALARAEAERRRGWRVEHALEESGRLRLAIRADTRTVASVTARLSRPTHDGADRVLSLDAVGRGRYTARLDDVARGQWRLRLEILDSAGETVRREKRLHLP